MRIFVYSLVFLLLCFEIGASGEVEKPSYLSPVNNFDLNRYLGKWFEIARLDHPFERGLEQVSAEYSLDVNQGVKVVNRGLNTKNNRWNQARGRAEFVGPKEEGFLKVSFFGPFFGAYVIFELSEDYQYAFVGGDDHSYLWLLSRTAKISPALRQRFLDTAKQLGYATENLIWVQHP